MSLGIGAEIAGIDAAAPLDTATLAHIHERLRERAVLVFPVQVMAPAQLAAFARNFGPLQANDNPRYLAEDCPDVMLVGNLRVNGESRALFTNGREEWHIDKIFTPHPNAMTLLYAARVPAEGGDTLFADLRAAYDSLPADRKRRLEGLHCVYSYEFIDAVLRDQDPTRPPLTAEGRAANPPARHPLVRIHPETGRRALCVSLDVMSHIEGLSRADSLALLRPLAAHAAGEDFVYRHRWRVGDLVVWDNRSVMHSATLFDAERYQRLLYRAIVADGDSPRSQ